ncbi:DUF4230 domain-containing protein, partial [Draconibacterium sp.]|nr:DUF4230 domain-containing protein [Draconibacterium sp.]
METLVFLGLILGLAGGIAITSFFFKKKSERHIKEQSVLLLDKIKQVCKLITVEGEFSELFSHRDEKNLFFKLVQLEKKALIIIKAKVLIGFDLTKINIEINSNSKQVKLSSFPEPEILSIDSDIEYYDVQKGIINKFSEADLTNLNKKSKEFIRDKVERSHLIAIAKNQANDTISVIRQLIESVGWELTADK